MARFKSKWVDVAFGSGFGVPSAWYVYSLLTSGKWTFTGRMGQRLESSPDSSPFFYWGWVGLWSAISLFCFFHAARGIFDIIRLHRSERDTIDDRND